MTTPTMTTPDAVRLHALFTNPTAPPSHKGVTWDGECYRSPTTSSPFTEAWALIAAMPYFTDDDHAPLLALKRAAEVGK